jgi:hypothetical protein
MSSGARCNECGAIIPADSPDGFCAKCLLALGLEKGLRGLPTSAPQETLEESAEPLTPDPDPPESPPEGPDLSERRAGKAGCASRRRQRRPTRRHERQKPQTEAPKRKP